MRDGGWGTALLTAAALTGFAANSLLCRLALGVRAIDAASFTTVRLASGALALGLLVRVADAPVEARRSGSWAAAAALFAYAAAFSIAYLHLGAGVGALLLFGGVQATMIGWGLRSGERPSAVEWAGLLVALAGLVALTLPGLSAPDPAAAGLMILAGVAWGVYSLLGRVSRHPLATTADNFLRTLPLAAAASIAAGPAAHLSWRGVALAVASGALASGVGYSLWYAALSGLTATRAAVAQLAVPVLTAGGAVVLLGEALTLRLCLSGAAILAGVGVALLGRGR